MIFCSSKIYINLLSVQALVNGQAGNAGGDAAAGAGAGVQGIRIDDES